MYDCSKIKRITIMYVSKGPGKYAGEERKILDEAESGAICQEANSRHISIEKVLKAHDPKVHSIVINTAVPFSEAVTKPVEQKEKTAEVEQVA